MKNKAKLFIQNHWKDILCLTIIYLVVFSVFYRWFHPGYFVNGDTWLVNKESAKYTFAPFVWEGFQDIGIFMTELPFIIIYFLSSLPTVLFGLEFNSFTIKLLFFLPYLAIAPLGMYLLAYRLTKNTVGSSIASLLYTINIPIVTSFAMGHLHITIPQAIFPLLLYFAIIYFEENSIVALFMSSILLIASSLYEFRFFYLAYIALFLFSCYQVLLNKSNIKKALTFFITLTISGVCFNLYWILPLFLSAINYSANPILNRPLFGSEFLNVLNPLTIYHPFWTPTVVAVFTSQIIPSFFLIFPFLALLGYLLNKKNKLLVFFLLLLIIGITLTKASNAPFEAIYSFLYTYFPGFKLFRESTKFFYFVTLSYSVMIAFLIKSLQERRSRYVYVVIALLLLITAYVAMPIVTGKAKAIFVPVDTTDDSYPILNDFLRKENKNTYFRILQVPTASSLNFVTDKMPNLHLPYVYSVWYEQFQKESSIKIVGLSDFLLYPQLENLLAMYSTKYIILPKSYSKLDGNIFYWYEKREVYEKKLDSLSYLKKINIGTDKISVYEVKYKPHLYFTSQIDSFYKNLTVLKADFQEVNPTKYVVHIHNLKTKLYLNFSEAYSPDWDIKPGSFRWIDAWKPNYMIDKKYHIENDAKLNSYLLDPNYIKKYRSSSEYKTNPDGSINVDITLYFKPQAYFYIGASISAITVLLLVVGLLYFLFRKRRQT